MIKIENLVKMYGDNCALDHVSFEVGAKEIVGFLGPNGAGKTTAMNILTGYLSSTSGTCSVAGVDILEHPAEAKRFIGYLPEQPPLYPEMTVEEYLNFVYDLKKCTLNRKQHLKEISRVVRIDDVYKRLIRNLSKGYRQRVGIAGALVSNPPILIFDEPTVGLDPRQIVEIRNLLRILGKDHTVILSTHILPEVQAVCDKIIIIDKGKIVANGTAEEIGRMADDRKKFTLSVSGPRQEVLNLLRHKEGVFRAEFLNAEGDGVNTFRIECDKGVDPRKSLFFSLAERGWAIMQLSRIGASLEDIFMDLVSGETKKKNK